VFIKYDNTQVEIKIKSTFRNGALSIILEQRGTPNEKGSQTLFRIFHSSGSLVRGHLWIILPETQNL
jgi:hypothetical protein